MLNFIEMLGGLYVQIFNRLAECVIPLGVGFSQPVTLAGILFACLVIGFVACIFWKGAKAQ